MPSYAKRQTKNGTVIDVRFRIINDTGVEVQKRLCGYPNKRAAEQAKTAVEHFKDDFQKIQGMVMTNLSSYTKKRWKQSLPFPPIMIYVGF